MAKTKYREPNEVNWRGIRPAHNGEMIFFDGDIEGGNTGDVLYTVPANKILLITAMTFDSSSDTAGVTMFLFRRNAGGTEVFITHYYEVVGMQNSSLCFPIPFELLATETIELWKDAGVGNGAASFVGILVDA